MNCYSDIINLRASKPAYNIQKEQKGEWDVFIPNDQFNGILNRVIESVFNNNADAHKSFWISGTYGTGKSHAGAVLKHLLCDDFELIRDYIDTEYQEPKHETIKGKLLKLREEKKLFPVTLYGLNSISHKDDLSLQLQRALSLALQTEGIQIVVKTDFDNYVEHIQNRMDFWELLINESPELKSVAPNCERIISALKQGDVEILSVIKNALRKGRYDIRLNSANICQWFYDVQNELAKQGEYNGFLIIWDEFTDVMTSDIGISLLVTLQELAEQGMNADNNSYFLLISHPSALNSLQEEEREKTKGRYHYMSYNMEPVSAFKIMSRKFVIHAGEARTAYTSLCNTFYSEHNKLLEIYSKTSNNAEETKRDIRNLYPLHPSTANLATYYAREAGSSSRSVFEFLGANPEIKEFLESPLHFSEKRTITADYLWNYVFEVFTSNISKFGAVTERFNSRKTEVKHKGDEFFAVFKGILLLNALNNIANHETVTPTEENIKNLFIGTPIDSQIDDILNYFNERGIIQRAPGGLFSIQYTALPASEIENEKLKLTTTQFKFIDSVIKFDSTVGNEMSKLLDSAVRATNFDLYSIDSNEYTLLNKIERGLKATKPYSVYIALLFAKNDTELSQLKTISANASNDAKFSRVLFIVFDTVFTNINYERFIEYQANATCAQKHGFLDQYQAHIKSASDLLREWVMDIRRKNLEYSLRGISESCTVQKICSIINNKVSPVIFSKGPESLEIIRNKPSKTHWKTASVKQTVANILGLNSKSEINSRCAGQLSHVQYLLQDSVDEDLHWLKTTDETHPLYAITTYIKNKLKNTNKNINFNLAEKLSELARPPYGLYQTCASMAMVAFAMREQINQLYDVSGSSRTEKLLVDDIVELFKSWENGNNSHKLEFSLQSKEAGELHCLLTETFRLNKQNTKSLKQARWAVLCDFSKQTTFPLWALNYTQSKQNSPEFIQLISNILKVCETETNRNPHLLHSTIEGLKKYTYELGNILFNHEGLVNTQNFEDGFIEFIKSDEHVNAKESETSEILQYIRSNAEGEAGLWKEDYLIELLKNWRLEKHKQAPTVPSPHPTGPTTIHPITPLPVDRTKKRESAKSKINAIDNLDEAKALLDTLCLIESDELLDTINNYV